MNYFMKINFFFITLMANRKYSKTFQYLVFFIIFTAINSCKNSVADLDKYFAFLGSNGNSNNPRVYSAIPGTGDKNLPRTQKIAILFDKPMNINSCIQAFSIQPTVRGFFTTTDTSLTFTPSALWDYGTYTYTLTKFCEDKNGFDLKDVFTANFSIGESTDAGTNPTIVSATIISGTVASCNSSSGTATNFLTRSVTNACMGNPTQNKITITFSRPMEQQATQASIAISPSLPSSVVWESSTVISYTSDSGLAYNQRYTLNISTSAQDIQGSKLLFPITGSFLVGTANILPTVSSIQLASGTAAACLAGTGANTDILTNNVTTACIGNPTINPIVFNFSIAMDTTTTQNAISFSPSLSGNFTWSAGNTVLTFTPTSGLQAGTNYTASIAKTALSSNQISLQNSISGSFTADPSATIVNTITVLQGTMPACNGGTGTALNILTNTVNTACLGNPTFNSIVWNFNFPMNTGTTQASISISPSLSGTYAWSGGNQVLTFTPNVKLTFGTTYTITVSTSAKTTGNVTLPSPVIGIFTAGNIITTPAVQSFGLASQAACLTYPGTGGGTLWTSANCFWDDTLAVLTPSSYQFQSGDTGTGASGSSNDCADVTSDNFRIIFNTYMDTNTTVAAVSLKRLSPPLTSIALATWVWTDCQAAFPFGCRVLTLSYAEQEASCNGNLFGNASTGGDFNLLRTNNAPANYPFYQISVSSSAKDVNGNFITPFTFSMEGK